MSDISVSPAKTRSPATAASPAKLPAKRLSGRIALVTGGAQGIGEGIARRFATEGATVAIADIDRGRAEAVVAAIIETGGKAAAFTVDIGDEGSVAALAHALEAAYARIDTLVNNAAILDATAIDELTLDRYREVIDINLNGAILVTLALLPLLRLGRAGPSVLNIASIMGLRGARDSLAYSTAKGGIVNFTRALACDLAGDGIRVNAIAPGFIDTRMAILPDGSGHEHETQWFKDVYLKHGRLPLGRAGQPADIAGPAFFLCSDDARYVTGQILLVDGGVSATF
jgi:NAD(P)-dependent dehydrogenase (short-subunit alcohol dehydrogenase family)